MIVSDGAVKNRVSVMVLAVMILVFGTYCYMVLPRESSPDITIPHVFVSTDYKGVSAADIETSITIHIEKKLKGLDRVKKIHSVSAEGLSQIDVEFIPGTDIDEVLTKVKDKVDEAMGEPVPYVPPAPMPAPAPVCAWVMLRSWITCSLTVSKMLTTRVSSWDVLPKPRPINMHSRVSNRTTLPLLR